MFGDSESIFVDSEFVLNQTMYIATRFWWILTGLICFSVDTNEAGRILAVIPSPSLSHMLIHFSVVETLAKEGHNVTVLAVVPNKFRLTNVTYIHIDGAMYTNDIVQNLVNKNAWLYKEFTMIVSQILALNNITMNNPKMIDFLQKHKAGDFDAVLLGYFMNDFMFGLGAHFQCPIIISTSISTIFSTNHMIGNPIEASYVPTLFLGPKQLLSFTMKVKNFLSLVFEYHVFPLIMTRKTEKFYR